jgi:hypothetical protein
MDTINIDQTVLNKFSYQHDTFIAYLYECIDTFKAKYYEIFKHEIPYNHIKVINQAFRGFAIQSIENDDHEGPDEGTEGLEIEYSDYRDVYDTSLVPIWPFRHVDTIYRYSNRERVIEYNINGEVLLEIAWNADNLPYIVQQNNVDSTHVNRSLSTIINPH